MGKRESKYGKTLLTKPRWFTYRDDRVAKSPFMWSVYNDNAYYLSLLGIINGVLPKFGWVLLVMSEEVAPNEYIITSKRLVKKWW